jgi:ABC-type branched-subunit amino acid transport system ATPase component
MQSILFVLVVIVGGAGSVAGPIVGAALVVLLPEVLAGLAEYRLLFFGALLLLVLWIAPRGIVGAFERRRTPTTSAGAEAQVAATVIATPTPRPLDAAGLSISFGGIRAAADVSFAAQPGRIVSLIGPNGAGKTTVLNLLSGFYKPDNGTVQVHAREIGRAAPYTIARAGLTRTYQTSQLFSSLTVEENLRVAQLLGHLGRGPFGALPRADDAAAKHAAHLARFVGYRGRLDRPASELPHVDRRLVEIARALATGASVLLLDEPAAGLSSDDKAKLAALLRRLADRGYTIVLVEHAMSIVMAISDSIVVLDAGAPIAAGDPAAVQRDPAVRRAYLGESAAPAGVTRTAPRIAPTQAPRPLLKTIGLGAGYGAEPVLKSLALEVREGETVAVLGANGAGKSTLMRALAGLHRPVQGQIAFAGEEIGALPAHRVAGRGLVLVPEGRQVFPELSVRDNIWLGAFLHGNPAPAELEAVLERFPRLRERIDQRAGLLSGGEQQMLAIARGLMARPKTLLLDEPSLGLAPRVIGELFAALDRLRSEGVTILLVDQIVNLALALADRGYVIESGRVVAQGVAAELAADTMLEQAYLGAGG